MEYLQFDPTSCDFPKVEVPVLPKLCRASLGNSLSNSFKIIRPIEQARQFVRARYALFEAFRRCGVGAGERVLLPAYHCRTMLDPAIRLGAQVVLYELNDDLSPNIAALQRFLETSQQTIIALLVTHFFGFRLPLEPLAALCNHYGITLIEDCAHALFTSSRIQSNPTTNASAKYLQTGFGQVGSMCIASPSKFFPCEDGGLLWSNDDTFEPLAVNRSQSRASQAKSWLTAARSIFFRAKPVVLRSVSPSSQNNQKAAMNEGEHRSEQSIAHSPAYDPEFEGISCLPSSNWVMRHTDLQRLAERRRENYAMWAKRFSTLPFCRALKPNLSEDCVPYMFPLELTQPSTHFYLLKRLGVPIWRWDDMAVSQCSISNRYRLGLLHLPCHQELTETQMNWLFESFSAVLTRTRGRV